MNTSLLAPIRAPEPDLTGPDMLARAIQIVPYLREKSTEIESRRSIPPDVDERLRAAGFYRLLQPRALGGYELDFDTFVDVMLELFRGDGSAGWVSCFMSAHILWITALDPSAQREIFGYEGDVRAVVPAAPTGKARPVDGGYRITGRWDWCSGMSVANWFMAVAVVDRGQPQSVPELITFATPSSNTMVEDNWHVLGLRGSGSVTARVEDLFVPDNFCTSFTGLLYDLKAPGHGVHENPLYSAPLIPVLWTQLGIAAVGLLQGLIDIFIQETTPKKSAFAPFAPLIEDKKVQHAMGGAIANHEVAKATLRQISRNHCERASRVGRGERLEWPDIQADHLLICKAARLCVEAAEALFHAAGSTMTVMASSAFQRFYRDLKVVSTHRALGFERAAENSGMVALGLSPATRN